MKDPNCTQCQEWEICPFHPALTLNVSVGYAPAPVPGAAQPVNHGAIAPPTGLRLLGPDEAPQAPARMTPADLACAKEDFKLASGAALDALARLYGIDREPGESDETMRSRCSAKYARALLETYAPRAGLRLLGPDDPEVSSDLIYLDKATGGVVAVPQGAERPSESTPSVVIGGLPLQSDEYRKACVSLHHMRITLPRGSEREVKLNAMYMADRMCHRPAFVAIDAPALDVRTGRAWFVARHTGTQFVTYVLRFMP